MDRVAAVIAELDVAVPQIFIDVKFVETIHDDGREFGINWNTKVSFTGGPTASSGTSSLGGTSSTGFPVFGGWNGLEIAQLSFREFSVVFEALMTEGHSKLLNNPKLLVLDNHEAITDIKTTIPIPVPQTQGTGGLGGGLALQQALTFEDKDVSISLKIIPHVTENDYVMLSITTAVAAITGFTGPDNDRPITSERFADTKLMVKAGDTAVIGGLIKEDEFINYKKVPILSAIPLIGNLFKHKTVEKRKSNLMIFITPKIQYFDDLTSKQKPVN